MDKSSKKSLIAKLSLISLLLISPLLSTSTRPYFLYFLLNLVIIALGVEAGILSFLKPLENDKAIVETKSNVTILNNIAIAQGAETKNKLFVRVPVRRTSTVGVVRMDEMNRFNALPSLFFIGSGEVETETNEAGEVETETNEAGEVEEEGGLSRQELFNKAEAFIGNFYKQVKLQRQESCKQIHGFY